MIGYDCFHCGMWDVLRNCCKLTACAMSYKSATVIVRESNKTQQKDGELEMDNVSEHKKICSEMNELYARKNADYGDSFHESFLDYGLPVAAIRIGDKYNRLKALAKGHETAVKNESIRDTLIDLANYAVMTVMELDRGAYRDGRTERESKTSE